MFSVLQQPPPSVSICKKSIVVNAYCAYLSNSNSQPQPDSNTNTNRKRCTVNVKGDDFRELMGIADKQSQLNRAIEITGSRLQASFDRTTNKQAGSSQVAPPLIDGPSKRRKSPCQVERYKPHAFSTPPSKEVRTPPLPHILFRLILSIPSFCCFAASALCVINHVSSFYGEFSYMAMSRVTPDQPTGIRHIMNTKTTGEGALHFHAAGGCSSTQNLRATPGMASQQKVIDKQLGFIELNYNHKPGLCKCLVSAQIFSL